MLANMSEIEWSDLGVDEPMKESLPNGTVTLLLADVEGSTQLWDTRPDEMTAAIANLDRTLADVVGAHHGVRPIEQGEGDSFVVAFGRASDAVSCALALQRAPLAPLRLRIALHTGEVQLRDANNYVGPAINRTARLRELAHGGQTVLSGTTGDLVADVLPEGAWLSELGTYALRDLPRPERVLQLCHPDLCNTFPPLRVREAAVAHRLPIHLTSFVGRAAELTDVRGILAGSRLVTLTGAGGVGKTRLAAQLAASVGAEYPDGTWWVDLAPITDPDLVPVTVARTLGLPDQPGRSPLHAAVQLIGIRKILVVLDNCEHLLDASAALVSALLGVCEGLTVLATSREPIGVPGEVTWRVPSMPFDSEAAELFADRAIRARPGFTLSDDDAASVREICRRLDGMPLAIELAAARVRALSPNDILVGLQDRFRLLTGGSRTAVRRQQTLQASVDWSHALLTEPERILFRRLAAFSGGFDLEACRKVACDKDLAPHQMLDVLALLVDKSLVIAETAGGSTRYRFLETVRQYAQEKLGESADAVTVRDRHRDYYTAMVATLDAPLQANMDLLVEKALSEIDNLRAAFAWSRENADTDSALRLAAALQPVWLTRGLVKEGSDWLEVALTDADSPGADVAPDALARALADKAFVDNMRDPESLARAQRSLAIARELDDPVLLARTLTACGRVSGWDASVARPYLSEAADIARAIDDRMRLCQILYSQAFTATVGAGEPDAILAAATEGLALADEIGDRGYSRGCRWCLSHVQWTQGHVAAAERRLRDLMTEADAEHSLIWQVSARSGLCHLLARLGRADDGRALALEALPGAAEIGPYMEGVLYAALALAELARGEVTAARLAGAKADKLLEHMLPRLTTMSVKTGAQIATASGDLASARLLADDDVARATGWSQLDALTIRARILQAQNEPGQAERDAYEALACAADMSAHAFVPDVLELLAGLTHGAGRHSEAARFLGAAGAIRRRIGVVRFQVYDNDYAAVVAGVRGALSTTDFDAYWAEGAALSTEDAIAYARRGRGERKRPPAGWASLTPTEHDVVGLVSEGLANKDIAARLFISPRTVQTHLTHVYSKLGLTSRVQLVHEAHRRA
jgi:predicted ATPase/class 3 adenylate cyclase/DNA-binding CsgD family transcriptional regulator